MCSKLARFGTSKKFVAGMTIFCIKPVVQRGGADRADGGLKGILPPSANFADARVKALAGPGPIYGLRNPPSPSNHRA
jgi:hypothetical protein